MNNLLTSKGQILQLSHQWITHYLRLNTHPNRSNSVSVLNSPQKTLNTKAASAKYGSKL